MSKAMKEAQFFYRKAQAEGFKIVLKSESVVSIVKEFEPNNKDAFAQCDIMAGSVLDCAPLKGGSVWGTDGGSVGGHVALTSGKFVMNKSGNGKRFTTALAALLKMFGE